MIQKILVSHSKPAIVAEEYFDWLNQFEWFADPNGFPVMSMGEGRVAHMDTLIRARENPQMGCSFNAKGVLVLHSPTTNILQYLSDRDEGKQAQK
jgi:hypothetical protein